MAVPARRPAATSGIGSAARDLLWLRPGPSTRSHGLTRAGIIAAMKRDLSKRIMALPIRVKISLLWRMFRDPDVPVAAKSVLPVLVAYLAMPFDLVPDFIPVLGQLDDLLIIAAGLGLFLWLTPRPVIEQHLRALE